MANAAENGVRNPGIEISVVAPAYNEAECVEAFVDRTDRALRGLGEPYELLLVDDGSTDATFELALGLTQRFEHLRVIRLSRNFGHELASTAGIGVARGRAVVLIDADLQDPPELIGELVDKWREGFQVVYAQRRSRSADGWTRRACGFLMYRLIRSGTRLDLPLDTGDYRLMDRVVVDAFSRMPERHRFVRGMVAWLGYRQTGVPFDREKRWAGKSKYGLRSLLSLSVDSVIGFTTKPLRLATYMGLILFVLGGVGFFYILVQKLFPSLGELVPWLQLRQPGYALLMCSVFLIGGMQSLMLGLLGAYVARIYEQTQGRPLYLVEGIYDSREADLTPPDSLTDPSDD
jgi:polyisoprenyl-phosphate glycosyltransferase